MVLPGVINSFTADTFIIIMPKGVTLTWRTSQCIAPSINGVTVATSGSKTYYPTSTTTYTLKAYSEAGGQSKSLTVIVQGVVPPPKPPPPTPPPTPPPVICTPGEPHCIGNDLYRCNPTGTAWVLEAKNTPYCIAQNKIPDPFTDFPGWIVWLLTSTWEVMLGFVAGQFNNFIGAVKNFTDNFMAQLAVFIKDPLAYLKKALDGVYATILSVAGQIADGVGKWYDENLKGTVDAIGEKLTGFRDWIGSGYDSLTKWWGDRSAEVGKWIDDRAGILRRGWDDTFGKVPGMIEDGLGGAKKYVDDRIVEYDKLKESDWFNLPGLVEGWIFEQITGYFTDALKGLNDEFDTMKKEKEEEPKKRIGGR